MKKLKERVRILTQLGGILKIHPWQRKQIIRKIKPGHANRSLKPWITTSTTTIVSLTVTTVSRPNPMPLWATWATIQSLRMMMILISHPL